MSICLSVGLILDLSICSSLLFIIDLLLLLLFRLLIPKLWPVFGQFWPTAQVWAVFKRNLDGRRPTPAEFGGIGLTWADTGQLSPGLRTNVARNRPNLGRAPQVMSQLDPASASLAVRPGVGDSSELVSLSCPVATRCSCLERACRVRCWTGLRITGTLGRRGPARMPVHVARGGAVRTDVQAPPSAQPRPLFSPCRAHCVGERAPLAGRLAKQKHRENTELRFVGVTGADATEPLICALERIRPAFLPGSELREAGGEVCELPPPSNNRRRLNRGREKVGQCGTEHDRSSCRRSAAHHVAEDRDLWKRLEPTFIDRVLRRAPKPDEAGLPPGRFVVHAAV